MQRLINTKRYELVESYEIPAPFPPPYVILSHTWISPQDEITYQDFQRRRRDIEKGTFKPKGWAKLRQYCDRVARDGWEWAWMDTCCIDKTNEAETQLAIFAMFRWYKEADVCIAYLADVHADKVVSRRAQNEPDLDEVPYPDTMHDTTSPAHLALKPFVVKSKWFTRGWTLQELIAPKDLYFVDHAWRRLGNREHWYDAIRMACGIEPRYFGGFNPWDFHACSIATRMNWASRRETTLEEDEAYSLLSLFGLSMPLIYGEGRWRAFYRLQSELIMHYDDDSIYAWRADPSTSGSSTIQDRGGRGMLASSIRDFSSASNIQAFDFTSNDFTITKSGLDTTAKRWRRKDDPSRCLIRLNCGPEPTRLLAIPLERVKDGYHRILPAEIYDMATIRPSEWLEDRNRDHIVIRTNDLANILAASSLFDLQYPAQIRIGKKYYIDYERALWDPRVKLLDERYPIPGLAENEVVVEPDRMVFVCVELQGKAGSISHFDVIINLLERCSPSVAIQPRGLESLRDPLGPKTSAIYEEIADRNRFSVGNGRGFQASAFDRNKEEVVGVALVPRTHPRRGLLQGAAGQGNTAAMSREYSIKITVRQNGQHDSVAPAL
ncbi:hypothetical protein PG989_010783 [Apiospora arundinis]